MCFLFNPEVLAWGREPEQRVRVQSWQEQARMCAVRALRAERGLPRSGGNLQPRGPARIYRRFGGIFCLAVTHKKTPARAFDFYSASGIFLGMFTIILPP